MGEDLADKAAEAFKARISGEGRSSEPGEANVEWGQVDKLRAVYELMNDQYLGPCLRQCLKPDVVIEMASLAYPSSVTLGQLVVLIELGRNLRPEELQSTWVKFLNRLDKDDSIPDWVKGLIKIIKVT